MDFNRKRPKHSGLELTPLIDVVFLLLVFLILTANFQLPSLSLQLPRGASEDNASEHVVLVELQENGELAVDGESVDRELLTDRLREALEPLELRAVRLRADERVPYGQLLPVIDAARAAGAMAVDLVHEGGGGQSRGFGATGSADHSAAALPRRCLRDPRRRDGARPALLR